jgi:hypothetical protein
MNIHAVGTDLFRAGGRTDRQTEMTKLTVVFSHSERAQNKGVGGEFFVISIETVMSRIVVKRM